MTNQPSQPDAAELAALYAVGDMTTEELVAFENRLLHGDEACGREFEQIRAVGDRLLRAPREVEPSLIARSDLINRLGLNEAIPAFSKDQPAADPFSENAAAMVLMRGGEIDWRPTGVPGVVARNLYVDHERKRATVLLRLDPGAVYPDHDHPDVEECLVLEGDLELGGKVMRKHDYMRIPKGGRHGTPRTKDGCLLLVTCGLAA
jgi:anti-sigma factor ChrR (cupin superfamily)